ncbi:TonB-dependent receptor [Sediminitomix flava]|uniref:TonB-dependent receptor-like protein n=1 Tax=Sediminitomix flava TaxID=379075 RepID=A0A315YWQ2_SEDFL|nr:TonB-dependent receptor [Sediminitomix flava]PWJ34200.1 TonB-dependent receptor-like protein [Sediminitomix flava]
MTKVYSHYIIKYSFILLFLYGINICVAQAQESKPFTFSGVIKDAQTGEVVPFASVFLEGTSIGMASDFDGKFSFHVPKGTFEVVVSVVGFATQRKKIDFQKNETWNPFLAIEENVLGEVEVTVSEWEQKIQTNEVSVIAISIEEMENIPSIAGNFDPIKVTQLLPGVGKGFEGSSDMFVRGGDADQNLVLLDNAIVYNAGHLFGFMSVFNSAVLNDVTLTTGGFNASDGGRLSSVMKVNTKDPDLQQFRMKGEIGSLASQLAIETPIVKDKLSISLAGRRTYADKVAEATGQDLPYYFYDVNGKITYKANKNNTISFSAFKGDDIMAIETGDFDSNTGLINKNDAYALNWKHTFSPKLSLSSALTSSGFSYNLRNVDQNELVNISYSIRSLGFKNTVDYYDGKNNLWKTGVDYTMHALSPYTVLSEGDVSNVVPNQRSNSKFMHEIAPFVSHERQLTDRIQATLGFRVSSAVLAESAYIGFEPRALMTLSLTDKESVKMSYSRMNQYLHRLSNSSVALPTDIWYPSNEIVKPQNSHQVTVGYHRNLPKWKSLFTLEFFYKKLNNLVEYKEGSNAQFSTEFDDILLQGEGRSLGMEVLLRKKEGKFTGWIAYTLAKSERQFSDINYGAWFPSRYDRRHNVSIVGNYILHPRWKLSGTWEYLSGARFTPIIARYLTLNPVSTVVDIVPVYSSRNGVKLADVHRLDLSVEFSSKPEKKVQWKIVAGAYNVYNRTSPVGIVLSYDRDANTYRYEQPGLFGMLPFMNVSFSL